MRIVKLVSRLIFGAFFVMAGVTHFTREEFFLKLMPDYIPVSLHRPAVLVSGVCEILLGVLLMLPWTSRWAAWGLMAYLIAVFPANIHAYQHSREIFPDLDPSLHFWRLPAQAVLIAWAYWYTRARRRPRISSSSEAVRRRTAAHRVIGTGRAQDSVRPTEDDAVSTRAT